MRPRPPRRVPVRPTSGLTAHLAAAVAIASAACVSDEFGEAQFRCEPGASGEQCPPGQACGVDGVCRSNPCQAGFEDCDGQADNGCEVEVAISPEHCGRCGHSCLGGPCGDGICQAVEIATAQVGPTLVVARAGRVHWITENRATIFSVSRDGGDVTEHETQLDGIIGGLAVDDQYLYFTGSDAGVVGRIPVAGGATFAIANNQVQPRGVFVDAQYVYWTTAGDETPTPGTVSRATLSGADRRVLADMQRNAGGIAVDGERAYWTIERANGLVRSLVLPDGAAEPFATDQYLPRSIVVIDGRVYWGADTKVVTAKLGSTVQEVVEEDLKVENVTADAVEVYWTTSKSVQRVPHGSTAAAEVLASDQPGANGIALDESYVYWTNTAGGTVMRLPKSP